MSQNWILAEPRLQTVIRKVKFTDFVKRAKSQKMQLAEFRFPYIYYFDRRSMETFRKILKVLAKLEDTILRHLITDKTLTYPP